MKFLKLFNLSLLSIFLIAGCAGGPGVPEGPMITPFPADGSTAVPTDTSIMAIFAPGMQVDKTTLQQQSTVFLLKDGTVPVAIHILEYTPDAQEGGVLSFTTDGLDGTSSYTVILTNDILAGGIKLDSRLQGGQSLTETSGEAGWLERAGAARRGTMHRDGVTDTGTQQGLSVSLEDLGEGQQGIVGQFENVAFSWNFSTAPSLAPGVTPPGQEEEEEEEPEPKAKEGEDCTAKEDCEDGLDCIGDKCTVPDICTDGEISGDETDVDCGGSCPKCEDGKACADNADCVSDKCEGDVCVVHPCNNGVKDGDESDVDCGGSCPKKCADGDDCNQDSDCHPASDCYEDRCISGWD